MTQSWRRDLTWVTFGVCLLALPFLRQAYHIDEPQFLAIARQILKDPRHPGAFMYNADGGSAPMSQGFATGPFASYLMALPLKWSGGVEWRMRLSCLPFDVMAALALYLLAGRFLSRPLLPTLIILACPGYWINMQHLMAEKWIGAFGFFGLYAFVRGVDEKKALWLWAAAALMAAALMVKYTAVFFLAPITVYGWSRRTPPMRLTLLILAVATPAALCLLAQPASQKAVLSLTASRMVGHWSAWSQRWRALLTFVSGGAPVLLLWPFWLGRSKRRLWAAAGLCTALATVLFLPHFDLSAVRGVDRMTGIVLAAGTLLVLPTFVASRPGRDRLFWSSWALAVGGLQICVYWSVVSRYVLFLDIPLIFYLARRLEVELPQPALRRLHAVSLALAVYATLILGWVDGSYAGAQRHIARYVSQEYRGRHVWFTGHWGLQYYMEAAGAEEIDLSRGGWDLVRPGDVVVIPSVNYAIIKPRRGLRFKLRTLRIDNPVPLRLICTDGAEGAFYTSALGFLPYSLSAGPLDEFTILEVLPG